MGPEGGQTPRGSGVTARQGAGQIAVLCWKSCGQSVGQSTVPRTIRSRRTQCSKKGTPRLIVNSAEFCLFKELR